MRMQANCMDNYIARNNFMGNTFDVATNGTLTLNKFEENYWDNYDGYDLNKDKIGDVPYRPLSLYSVLVEKNPPAMLLYRSFMITLLDRSERIIPSLTPRILSITHQNGSLPDMIEIKNVSKSSANSRPWISLI